MDGRKAARHYALTWFVPDALASFPFDVFTLAGVEGTQYAQALTLLRLFVVLARAFRNCMLPGVWLHAAWGVTAAWMHAAWGVTAAWMHAAWGVTAAWMHAAWDVTRLHDCRYSVLRACSAC